MPIRISKSRVALSGIPLELAQSASIASASVVDLATATGNEVHITGAVGPITSFGTMPAGAQFLLAFDSTPAISYNAGSMVLNTGGSDYTCAAGDRALAVSEGAGNWLVTILRNDGAAPATTANYSYGESITQGDILCVRVDGKVYKANATAIATARYPVFGLALATAASGVHPVLLRGSYQNSAKWTGGTALTPGAVCYLSTSAGGTTQAQPSATDNIIETIGIATATDTIQFNPSIDFITHV